jgi:hypothetical protein
MDIKKLFSEKYKLDLGRLYSIEFPEPEIQAGEHQAIVIDCKVMNFYGDYEGNKKVTLKFELKETLAIEKEYFVNGGISTELASLVGEVFTEYEKEELDLRDLIGKSISGLVTYYYDNKGNIVYNISNYKGGVKS